VRALLIAATGLLAACATPSPPNTREARMTGTFDYICAGQPAQVTFDNDAGTATLVMAGQTTLMGRQATRSGWLYQNPSTTILGNETTMQISGPMGNITCTKK
jgi:hypothetical protein